ncbi:MAG TPA: gluconate 2-dehydrogenase subunit 3 family protein [Bryobacteraceae bacterium]|nr:gluconate 2-dehydrogenase subunit 3 family protein [Bryobacteraceae bacterium]
MEGHSRRELIKIAAAAVAAPAIAAASVEVKPLFFTPPEFQMLDELTEIIIPTDGHSPGAKAAKVAVYMDKSLSEAFEDEPRQKFREGLKLVDSLSHELNHKPFLEASPKQRVAVVSRMAQNEKNPKKPVEHFFTQLKAATAFAYYTSSIGIHQEMGYLGNTLQTVYAGHDASEAPIHLPDSSK